MKKGVLILASVLAAAAVYIAYTQISLDVYKVKVDSMTTGNVKISLDLTGEVKPDNESDITTAGGQISDVYVAEGDTVKAGDPLFSYNADDVQNQLDAAQKELDSLQAQQKQQTQSVYQNLDSSMSQYAQNAVSLAQSSGYELYHYNNEITNMLAKAVSDRLLASVSGDIQSLIQSYLPQIKDVLSSDTSLQQDSGSAVLASIDKNASLADQIVAAQKNVSTLQSKVAGMKVASAIDGKVLEVDIKKGQSTAANTTAMVIADTASMEVHAKVSSKDIKSLKTGMDVVMISSDGNENYSGVISTIGQKVISSGDGGENMTDLVVTPKKNMDELPGSSIDLEVVLSQKKNVNVISLDCLTADGSVFVVDSGNIAHKRALKKGLQDDYNVEITGGLAQGEKVVLNPGKDLKDGQKVTIVD